jgi:hypothetical protein
MSQLAPTPIFRGVDAFGFPLYLGQLGTFIAGTNTPQATYKDSLGIATNTNPIILNPRGECSLWLDPTKAYKLVLSDALGNLIWSVDNVTIGNANPSYSIIPTVDNLYNLGSLTFAWANIYARANVFVGPNLSPIFDVTTGNVGYYARMAVEIAAAVIPTSFAYPDGNVLRYGADPTGVADSTYAFQQACLSTYAGWVPTSRPRQITVPSGRYKFAGVNTPYGTPTVFLRAGMSMIGGGMGTFMDCSAWGAVTTNVFQSGWGYIAGIATQDSGGQPPEIAEMFFLGGPSGGGATISHKFPGGIYHDLWFSGPGLGIYMGGCWVYNCEFDIGLTGITVGGGNQTITNCRFFNQNFNITFDTTVETSDVLVNDCSFEYTQFAAVQIGAGAANTKGIKFVGCDFFMNAQFATYISYVVVNNPNAQVEFDGCSFHNWGGTAGQSNYAVQISAAGSVVDFKSCLFDGQKTNASYTQSTTAAGIFLNSGSARLQACQFRNLPATWGVGISYVGATQNSLQINGLLYSSIGAAQVVNITNSNAASACYLGGVKGDAVTPLVNAQSTVIVQFGNPLKDWFGPITTSGASHVVLGVPYQFANAWQITLRANINSGGNASYRKITVTNVEKDNDFAASAKSFITTNILIQGAANLNGVIATVVEFGTVGGTQTIALSNSGNLAISWPNTYTSESVDVQVLA